MILSLDVFAASRFLFFVPLFFLLAILLPYPEFIFLPCCWYLFLFDESCDFLFVKTLR